MSSDRATAPAFSKSNAFAETNLSTGGAIGGGSAVSGIPPIAEMSGIDLRFGALRQCRTVGTEKVLRPNPAQKQMDHSKLERLTKQANLLRNEVNEHAAKLRDSLRGLRKSKPKTQRRKHDFVK